MGSSCPVLGHGEASDDTPFLVVICRPASAKGLVDMHHFIDLVATLLTTLTLEGPPLEGPAAPGDGDKKQQAKERFEELDLDADGRLTLAEYVHGREGKRALAAAKRFKKMDTDDDRSVTPEEFAAAAKRGAAKEE